MSGPQGQGSAGGHEGRLERAIASFLEAEEAGARADRDALLVAHPEVAAELRAFLDAHDAMRSLAIPLRVVACAAEEELVHLHRSRGGSRAVPAGLGSFGDYELLEELGCGGVGVVYRARDRKLNRTVALKRLLDGPWARGSEVRRLLAEAEAVAHLDHANIVPVYEAGEYQGHHYFSMRLMEGGGLDARLDQYSADPRAAAELTATVARAIEYAHRRGVLHRDLKPSNILLDAAGTPHVGDFGLAKRVETGGGPAPSFTVSGEVVGSPPYMAPEQATGRRDEVTTATDVYGLGATLYALLTGRPPFRADSVVETLGAVRGSDPVPPGRLNPLVAPDMEAICLKCLEKAPGRRYSSALALAEDIERFLAGEPTLARPLGRMARIGRWVVRNRRELLGVGVVLLVAGLAGLGGSLYSRLEQARQLALAREGELGRRDVQARNSSYVEQIRLAAQLGRSGDARRVETVLDGLRPVGDSDDLRGFEWHYLRRLLHQERHSWEAQGGHQVYQVTYSPNGRILATCGADGTARLWDSATLAPGVVLRGHRGDVNAVDFAPDGRTLATVGDDATLRFWDTGGRPLGEPLPALGDPPPAIDEAWALAVKFTTGGRIVSGGTDATVRVWDIAARRPLAVYRVPKRVEGLAPAPDGSMLVVATHGMTLSWFDLTGVSGPGPRLLDPGRDTADHIYAAAFSPDGRTLAVTHDHDVDLWDVPSRSLRAKLKGHAADVYALAFSPDGHTLATGDDAGAVWLHDAIAGKPMRALSGHRDRVWGVAFSADGSEFATSSRDRTVKVWDSRGRADRTALAGLQGVVRVAFRDSATLVGATNFGETRDWDVRTGATVATSPPVASGLIESECGTVLAPGARFAAVLTPGAIRLAELSGKGAAVSLSPETSDRGAVIRLTAWFSFSTDGSLFVTKIHEGGILVREAASRRWRGGPFGSRTAVPLGFSPAGTVLVYDPSAPHGQQLALFDPATGRPVVTAPALPGKPLYHRNAFSPDGASLAVAVGDGSVCLLDTSNLGVRSVLAGHVGEVHALAFSPDGRTVATGGEDRIVRLWHTESGRELLALEGHRRTVESLEFSPDGRTLASDAFLWHARPWSASDSSPRPATPSD